MTAMSRTPDHAASRAIAHDARGGVSGRMTARLVRLLEQRGLDAARVCARAGLSRDEAVLPSARIPYAAVDRLVEATADVLGDAGLAAAIATTYDADTYDAAGLVLVSSATFGEGLERAFAYQRLWGDGERFVLARHARGATIRFRHPGTSARAAAILSELAFIEIMTSVRMLARPDACAQVARFVHAPLTRNESLSTMLGVVPNHGASANELELGPELIDAAIVLPPGVLAAMFEQKARRALSALPARASYAARVRALFEDRPDALSMRIGEVAKLLRMSARTLQRRLHVELTSFDAIVDDVRRERAELLFARGASVKETALVLGYADPGALARARARWRRRSID